MTTNAFLSNLVLDLVGTASPLTYTSLPEIIEISPVGQTTNLKQVTHLQSDAHEYIGALEDGDEFTVTCNKVNASPDIQSLFRSLRGQTRTIRITETDTSVSPNVVSYLTFSAVFMSPKRSWGVDEQATRSFTFKITGDITES